MLSEKMQEELNKQLNAELYSSYLYLSMSSYYKSANLRGFSNWMYVQAQEELVHAMKFYDFINQRNGRVILSEIKAPPQSWDSPQAAFEAVFKHEQFVTSLIHSLVELTVKDRDHVSNVFLQWFVAEQVEEEESAKTILDKLKLMKGTQGGLFMLDKELSLRTFNQNYSQ